MIQVHGFCFLLYLASYMGLRYLTFMGRGLESRKKLMSIRLMNNADVNGMNIVDNVSIFSDSVAMNYSFSV